MNQRRPPRDQRPISSASELTALWASVVDGEPFRMRQLWWLFLDDWQRPVGPLLTIDNLPDGPYDVPRRDLTDWCAEILTGPGAAGSVALLLTRPGGRRWTVSDRAWGRFLVRAANEIEGRAWPVNWAHEGGVEEFELR
jgi:hypothetical protein